MQTTDFTGTYDYEKEEARRSAYELLDDLASGYSTFDQLPARIAKEKAHWSIVLGETMPDFINEFNLIISHIGLKMED